MRRIPFRDGEWRRCSRIDCSVKRMDDLNKAEGLLRAPFVVRARWVEEQSVEWPANWARLIGGPIDRTMRTGIVHIYGSDMPFGVDEVLSYPCMVMWRLGVDQRFAADMRLVFSDLGGEPNIFGKFKRYFDGEKVPTQDESELGISWSRLSISQALAAIEDQRILEEQKACCMWRTGNVGAVKEEAGRREVPIPVRVNKAGPRCPRGGGGACEGNLRSSVLYCEVGDAATLTIQYWDCRIVFVCSVGAGSRDLRKWFSTFGRPAAEEKIGQGRRPALYVIPEIPSGVCKEMEMLSGD